MAQTQPVPTEQGQTVQVNGLKMYYEESGSGEPLILLHGGTVTSRMWGRTFRSLPVISGSSRRTVVGMAERTTQQVSSATV